VTKLDGNKNITILFVVIPMSKSFNERKY